MRSIASFAVVLFALSAALPAIADTTATPMRHLVYSFTYGSTQNVRVSDQSAYSTDASGNITPNAGSGMSNYQGALKDRGTMLVDVMREQPDKGLVVVVSENAENTRKASPATCVVYANTEVICDPNKTVNPEEYTLLRFMAQNFVDPNMLDAKKHWGYDTVDGGMELKSDYTIVRSAGPVMTIDEVRSITRQGTQGQTTNVQSKIDYDFGHAVPMAIDEYVTQRSDQGVGGHATTIYQTDLKLVSDSMAKSG
jgi:hypothetical protein